MTPNLVHQEDAFAQEALAYIRAQSQFKESLEALLEWRKVRPFLFDGQCCYSRSLLQQILDSYLICCKFKGEEPDKGLVRLIRKLMSSGPPPRTPPPNKAPRDRGFAF